VIFDYLDYMFKVKEIGMKFNIKVIAQCVPMIGNI